jgi:hypothetical protein
MSVDLIVETRSCYVGLCDEASSANRLGFMDAELSAGKAAVRLECRDECFGLFVFNERLMHLADRGEMLSWTLLFDGVFRAVAKVESSTSTLGLQHTENLGANVLSCTLACPTGRLILTCLSNLGVGQSPFLVVEPGLYQVRLERDEEREVDHSDLEGIASYPDGHGPDWHFHVQRVGSLHGGA